MGVGPGKFHLDLGFILFEFRRDKQAASPEVITRNNEMNRPTCHAPAVATKKSLRQKKNNNITPYY